MDLDPELLEKLACPRCRGPLSVAAEGAALDCAACALRYDVEDGIPALVVERARPLAGLKS